MLSSNFTVLSNLPQLPLAYIQEGINNPYVFTEPSEILVRGKTYASEAPLFSKTEFCSLLQKEFGRVIARYLKNPPYSLYDWHTDKFRNCGINWVVQSNPEAKVWYRSSNHHGLFWDIEEAQYQDHYPTLLDTTKEHSVFNNSTEERIILSVTLVKRPSYQEVADFLSKLTIEQY